MKLTRPDCRLAKLYFPLFLILLLLSTGSYAQSRKATASKKPTSKNSETRSRDAKKLSRTDAKKLSAKEKLAAKKKDDPRKADPRDDKKKGKLTAKEQARENAKKKKSARETAEERKAAAERRRAEEAHRQAILAERRRREQAAREARARKLAFERGLRTETVANISNDKTEGEDIQIRKAAVNALGSHAGTVVVMEAQTGKVVTIVNQDWAIRNGFKPCSTIKLVTAVAGINEEIIEEDGGIKRTPTRLNLQDALAYSNNTYFQKVGVNMGTNKMISYAKDLGLGEPTGINVDGETSGRLPYGNSNARIYSHGDDFEVTPLQLAVMVSAISNGGKRVVPHVPRMKIENTNFRGTVRREIKMPKRNLQGVIPGMIGAAEYGTARRGVDSAMGVAGKTGSCISKGSWVGLFASVAPIEDPKYAVVVITRGQSERGKYAAAIAGKIYSALSPRLTRRSAREPIYVAAKPKPTTEVFDEEEDDVDTEAAATAAAADRDDVIVAGGGPSVNAVRPSGVQRAAVRPSSWPVAPVASTPKKLVTKTVQSKPVKFPPVVITFKKDGTKTERPLAQRPRIVENK